MGPFKFISGALLVRALAASCVVLPGGTAAGQQWWAWTGEAGDNDLANPNDWRWSNYMDSTNQSGNVVVSSSANGFYHPLSVTGNGGVNIETQRSLIYGSNGAGGSKTAIVPSTENLTFTYGTGFGGNVTVNINGGTLNCSGGIGDNGLWNDPLAAAEAHATSDSQGNSAFAPDTIRVDNGGTFLTTSVAPSYGSGSNGNLGVYIDGKASVNITGQYGTGSNNGSSYYGGGFLTVEGYNAASSLSINTLEFEPANLTANVSGPGTLNVILDSTNGHGTSNNFDTVTVGNLNIPGTAGSAHSVAPSNFNLTLAGYTPLAGDWFQIINATTLSTGTVTSGFSSGTPTTPGGMAPISVNGNNSISWDTPFSVVGSTATFQFEQSYNNTGTSPGVWLDVISAPAAAVNGVWTGGGGLASTGWSTAGNWSAAGVPGFTTSGSYDMADFPSGITNASIALNVAAPVLSKITFNDGAGAPAAYTITQGSSSGNITLSGTNAGIIVDGGTSNSISAPLVLATSASIITSASTSLSLAGNISGTGGLAIAGSGLVALSGSSSYGGATTVTAGTLAFTSIANADGATASALGAPAAANGTITLGNATPLPNGTNGTLQFVGSAGASSNRTVALDNDGTLDASGGSGAILTLSGGTAVNGQGLGVDLILTGSGEGIISGSILGTQDLVKNGPGTWVLSGSEDYPGFTSVNAGTLLLASSSGLPAGTDVTVAAGGTLLFDPSRATGASLISPQGAGVANAVPEPGTLALLIAGLAAGLRRKKGECGARKRLLTEG